MPIPKLLHQTAKTADISDRWKAYQRGLQRLHPDWAYRLWTDDDNRELVRRECPDLFDLFQKLPKNIMRADVIRYVLMYRLGGLYMDLDYEMLRPFDLLQYDLVLPLEAGHAGGLPTYCNSIFASAPGHPFFKAVLDELAANPPLDPAADAVDATGPGLVSRVYRRVGASLANACTPEEPLFSPLTPRNRREYRRVVDAGVAYGIHHCDGTWREYTFPQRCKVVASRLIHRLI